MDAVDTSQLLLPASPDPSAGTQELEQGQDQPAAGLGQPTGQRWIRKRRTWPQRIGAIVIAAAAVAGAAWYVPQVMSADRQLLTGTVVSSGVVTLNFINSGEIGKMDVHAGQAVRKGEVLAAEYAPDLYAVIAADKAANAADQMKIKQAQALKAAYPADASTINTQIAAFTAQLTADEAQLAMDRMKAAVTQIVAPAAGVVVAANGVPGQAVTSTGIRVYATDSPQAPGSTGPQFSLVPEGPQPVRKAASPTSALPVIALRTSASWQVVALVPENSVAGVQAGLNVTVSVPAAGIAAVAGRVGEVLPTPESTAQGTDYQAVVTITGHEAKTPLNGMAADIRLAS